MSQQITSTIVAGVAFGAGIAVHRMIAGHYTSKLMQHNRRLERYQETMRGAISTAFAELSVAPDQVWAEQVKDKMLDQLKPTGRE